MSQNEKLGIEINIDLGKAKEQIDRLNGLLAKLGQSPDAAQKSLEKLTARIEALGKATGLAPEKVKSLMKAFEDSSSFEKFFKNLGKFGEGTEKVLNAEKAMIRQRNKDLETAGNERMVLIRRQTQQELEERKRAVQQIQAQSSQQQLAWNAAARTQGAKYQGVQGGFVRSSVQAQNLNPEALAHIRAEATKMNAALSQSPKHVNVLNGALGKLTARIAEFYSIRGAMFAVTNQLQEATRSAISLNQAMYDIAAISGAPVDSVNVFSDAILKIAKNSRFTADEVSALMKVLAQAGVKMEQLPAVSEAVGMFATATGSSPAVSADLTTTAMNVYGIAAENVARITNAMTAALNESKLSTEGLATAFNYLAPQAAQMGMSMEQTLGMIATQAQAGIEPSTIGTGLSQLIKDLAAPKPRLKKLLEVYGIDEESIDTTKHTLDEVADVFRNHNVRVQDLMAAMDTRVGRAMITSMTLGGDAFRLMTENVTGTNATMIAFDKSMQGAQARLNVIKQTFASTVVTLGQGGLGGALSMLTEGITSFVRGLASAPGQLLLVAAAIGGIVLAVKALSGSLVLLGIAASATGIGQLLGAVVLLGFAIGKLGDYLHKEEDAIKASNEALTKKRTITGEYVKLLNRAATENSSHNESMKEAAKLYREEGELALPKIAKLKGQSIKLSAELRTEITKFAEKHPEYLELLNKEKISLTELYNIKVRINKESQADDISRLNKANSIRRDISSSQSVLALYEQELVKSKNSGAYNPGRTKDDIQRDVDRMKKSIGELNLLRTETLKPVQMPYASDELGQVFPIFDKPKPEKPDKPPPSHAAEESGVDILKRVKNREEKNREELKQEALHQARLTGEAELQALQKAGDETKDKKLAVEKQLDEEYARRKAERAAAFAQLAGDFGGSAQLNADGSYGITGYNKKKVTPAQVKLGLAEVEMTQKEQEKADQARKIKEQAEIAKMAEAKKDGHGPKSPNLIATRLEKQDMMTMKSVQQRITLRKEEAWTAEEVNKLDQELLSETIKMGEMKTHNLTKDNEEIQLWMKKTERTEATRAEFEKYTALHDNNIVAMEAQNALLAEQREELKRIASLTDSIRFSQGVRGAFREQTDTGALSERFGSDITNSAFNGITGTLSNTLSTFTLPDQDAIDSIKSKINELNVQKAQIQASISSITSKGEFMTGADKSALNEQASGLEAVNASLREQEKLLDKQGNAWSRFKDGLAETMKLILKTLQEYIIKLMVVALVKKIAGVAAGSGGEGTIPAIENVGGQDIATGLAATGATGGLVGTNRIGKNPLMAFASGGLVPMMPGADPNKDSVHALLQPGEFILPASVTRKVGIGFLENLRAQKFAEGGLVGGTSRGKGSSGEIPVNLTLINVADVNSIPQQPVDANQVINIVSFDINKKGTIHRTMKLAI